MLFRDSYEDAWRRGYRDLTPANQYNVDYSLLGTARVEPLLRRIRIEMAGAGLHAGERQGRVQPRPARDRVPLRRGAGLRRPPRDLQERRQGDRRPGGHGDHLHGQAERSARATPATSTSRCATPTARRRCSATGRRGLSRPGERVLAGLLATMREFTLLYAPNINSYKRYQPGIVRADRAALGRGQPHLRAAAGRARAVAAGGEPGARRRRQPVPGDRRRWSPARCTASSTSWSWSAECTGNAYDDPDAPTGARRRCATR